MARNNNIQPVQVEKQWECRLAPGPGPAGASSLTELQKYSPTTASRKHRPRYCTEPQSPPRAGQPTPPLPSPEYKPGLELHSNSAHVCTEGPGEEGDSVSLNYLYKNCKGRYKLGRKGEAGAVNASGLGWGREAVWTSEKTTSTLSVSGL